MQKQWKVPFSIGHVKSRLEARDLLATIIYVIIFDGIRILVDIIFFKGKLSWDPSGTKLPFISLITSSQRFVGKICIAALFYAMWISTLDKFFLRKSTWVNPNWHLLDSSVVTMLKNKVYVPLHFPFAYKFDLFRWTFTSIKWKEKIFHCRQNLNTVHRFMMSP